MVWCSVSSLMTTTEAVVADFTKEEKELMPGMGGGMGGMVVALDCPQYYQAFINRLLDLLKFRELGICQRVLRWEVLAVLWVCPDRRIF